MVEECFGSEAQCEKRVEECFGNEASQPEESSPEENVTQWTEKIEEAAEVSSFELHEELCKLGEAIEAIKLANETLGAVLEEEQTETSEQTETEAPEQPQTETETSEQPQTETSEQPETETPEQPWLYQRVYSYFFG